jgi:hypothetical protein
MERKMKVIKDKEGSVINIGEWDYMVEERIEKLDPPKDVALSEEQLEQFKLRVVQIVKNPMPDGAYEDEAEVVTGPDGGLYLANDPRVSQVG